MVRTSFYTTSYSAGSVTVMPFPTIEISILDTMSIHKASATCLNVSQAK